MRPADDTSSQIRQEVPMVPSGFRMLSLLALMFAFPVLVILSLAAALAGCGQPTLPPSPPQVLASNLPVEAAFGIAVDSTTVYVWPIDPGPVLAIPIDGGTATPVGIQADAFALAVDERRIYWSDGSSILACDKSNCTGSTVLLAASQLHVLDLAIDDTNVYWGTISGDANRDLGTIMKVNKNGGVPLDAGGAPLDGGAALDAGATLDENAPVQLAGAGFPSNVAVDATYVYWVEMQAPNSGVKRVPIGGGTPSQLADSDLIGAMGLALDADNVYFMNGARALYRVSKNGGPPQVMLSSLGTALGLETDGTNLYIGADPALVKVPLAGGFASPLATNLGASYIALDANNVYVAGGDTVLKVAK